MKFYTLFTALFFTSAAFCFAQNKQAELPDYLQPDHAVNAVTMVMVHDVTNPPVAARYYAYCMLGAYNLAAANNKSIPPLESFVKDYKHNAGLDTLHIKYDPKIAAYYSILEIGKSLLPSGFMLKDDEENFIRTVQKTGVKQTVINNSVKAAQIAAAAAVDFSRTDHYSKLSALKRYTPIQDESKWYPTPPGYFEAVEPNWKTIRTMVIDSANQYKPDPLIPFSKDTASAFYRQVKAVYDVSKHLTTEQINQAMFWDCNPFAITTSGHMMIGYKKISPGGHWMHIAGLVTRKAKLNFDNSVVVLTLEGITLMDAFISCWEEKYDSNRIRPETYINRYMDVKWQPILQTPPFPEYTSGHAVISNAAAEVLTYLLGDNFEYTDNTEIPFGSSERSFTSFRQAAAEASMSRFYGGIHYPESIDKGNTQGKLIAAGIIAKLKKAGINRLVK
ncbi:vanadium-dependent haloperoxidase [Mucilaginibacter sp. L3T2-6]|uniref:vanadium-dependent haloperoxidase n=1 Tax=Mucilaginibacter sp. L3T2-6 TaxID=3062491 RepID=UPI002677354B|nr:vanadium-dependent haloperoxidase [Mucilaginibacter sp. L3T2-6]MDO3643619.1 vanadium-dependent haloperoxidase [Mucilaginibacter sp. L3T2-6]MDV6216133.1 vanadium-dependent haloperoxidase [Mucilaginibacter sp. L3T2-6]